MSAVFENMIRQAQAVDAIFPPEANDREYRARISELVQDFAQVGVASIELPEYDRSKLSSQYPSLLRRTQKALVRAARANGYACSPYIHRTDLDETGTKVNLLVVAKDLGIPYQHGQSAAAPKYPDIID